MMMIRALAIGALYLALQITPALAGPADDRAAEILQGAGVRGGLIVQLGCGDGKLTAALRVNDRYLVHGLDRDADNVQKARAHIKGLGRYGPVSVDRMTGDALPYIDNLVNLLVAEKPDAAPAAEILRVLAPEGVAYVKRGGEWTKTVKPWPREIDEWTHYLHDASNNAVAHDSVVGPPRRLQWVAGPRWSRHHDRMVGLTGLVSAGGRIFYTFDEGPTAAIVLPQQRVLIARDAFNGAILWKRPIPTWHPHLWPYKSGPAQLPRRLVAVGERVYAVLGYEAPLTALDAATGEIVRTYENTKATGEAIAADGVLFLLVNPDAIAGKEYDPQNDCMHTERNWVRDTWAWKGREKRILAVRGRNRARRCGARRARSCR